MPLDNRLFPQITHDRCPDVRDSGLYFSYALLPELVTV